MWFIARREQRVVLLLTLLGSAGTLLFFGYVEFYLPVFTFTALYLLAGLRSLETGGRWLPVLFFVAACAAHFSALALLPSLVFVLLHGTRLQPRFWSGLRGIVLSSLGALALGVAVYVATGMWKSDGRVVMPAVAILRPAGLQSYTLLSPAHLLDLANLPLLLAPIPALFLLALPFLRRERKDCDAPPLRFLLLVLFFFCVFLFFANASLGWARDWDLAAPLGAMFTVTAFAASARMRRPALPASLAAASLAILVPWIVVNVSPRPSAARFEEVVELDSRTMYADYALSGYEALRKHYLHQGDAASQERIEKRMVERLGYPEHYRLLIESATAAAESSPAQAGAEYAWMLGRLHRQAAGLRAGKREADYAISLRQVDSIACAIAYQAYAKDLRASVDGPAALLDGDCGLPGARELLRGMDAFAAKRFADALHSLITAEASGFDAGKLAALRCISLLSIGRGTEAEDEYERAVLRFPADGELPTIMGIWLLNMGDPGGRAYLEDALRLNPPERMREKIEALLARERSE